jgi:large subunit ribosomal protein L31
MIDGRGRHSVSPSEPKEKFVNQQPVLHHLDVRCASCGTSFAIRSTAEAISVDICSTCHPAYTGRERTIVSGGQIDRFNRRRALAAA